MKKMLLALIVFWAAAARATLADDYNWFGFRLLQELMRENPGGNVFVSPASLAFALSMVANGARGETLAELRKAMDVSGDIADQNKELLAGLAKLDPKVKLEIANSIWVDTKAMIKPDFLEKNKQAFGAGIANVDFQDPATVGIINQWVSQSTHDKIKSIVEPPLRPDDRMIVLNAVYFKGSWSEPFEKSLTTDKPFITGKGKQVTQPRMMRTGSMAHTLNDELEAVRLPYGAGGVEMTVVLPRQDMAKVAADLNTVGENFGPEKGTLELPKFKMENEYELIPALEKLGIRAAFGRAADFGGISEEPLNIGDVKQKTYVDVNEEGTEAAAVTGLTMRAMARAREPQPFHMVVDRPFFVIIKDKTSGLILFLGAIADPE